MKITKKTVSLIVMLIVCIALITGCGGNEINARSRIKDLTDVEVPENSTIVYHHQDNAFVNGRRAQYSVFKFDEKPELFLLEYEFQEGRNSRIEEDFAFVSGFLTNSTSDIPTEYQLNWENEYLWIRKSNVYFVLFTETLLLMVYVVGS